MNKPTLINLTGKSVKIRLLENINHCFMEAQGNVEVIRHSSKQHVLDGFMTTDGDPMPFVNKGMAIRKIISVELEGLPEPKENTIYIVRDEVLQHVTDRPDVVRGIVNDDNIIVMFYQN
jgi:hypothetical protein